MINSTIVPKPKGITRDTDRTPPANKYAGRDPSVVPRPPSPIAIAFAAVGITLLCTVYLLIPVERGFPLIYLGNIPFTLTFLTTVLVFSVITLQSGGSLLHLAFRPHSVGQSLIVLVLAVSALMSENPRRAATVPIYYFSTFVLNYMLLVHFLETGHRRLFVWIICTVGSSAALVGVLEFILGYKLPFYAAMDSLFRISRSLDAHVLWNRTTGTLGNPIVFGVAMCGIVPFALELRSKVLRASVAALLLLAASLTVSRTIFGFIAFLALGYLAGLHRAKKSVIARDIIIGVLLFFGLLPTQTVYDWIIAPWSERVGGGADLASVQNAYLRLELTSEAFDRIRNDGLEDFIVGRGVLSGSDLARTVGESLDTLDNTYINLLYESGAIGLGIFLAVWGRLLIANRRMFWTPYHFHTILGWLSIGLGFVQIFYASCNLPIVASVATLTVGRLGFASSSAIPPSRRLAPAGFRA